VGSLGDQLEPHSASVERGVHQSRAALRDDLDEHLSPRLREPHGDLSARGVPHRVGEGLLHDPPHRVIDRGRQIALDSVVQTHPHSRGDRGPRELRDPIPPRRERELRLAGYCIVMVVPALLLLIARIAAAQAVERPLQRFAGWMERTGAETTSWLLGIIGFLLARAAWTQLGIQLPFIGG
jgi:hypothetical protein